jgi:hypothetical protein
MKDYLPARVVAQPLLTRQLEVKRADLFQELAVAWHRPKMCSFEPSASAGEGLAQPV